jgi:hypothetical protein
MMNLALNTSLIVAGLGFIAASIWGKPFYKASWGKPLWGRIVSAAFGVLLVAWGVLSVAREK